MRRDERTYRHDVANRRLCSQFFVGNLPKVAAPICVHCAVFETSLERVGRADSNCQLEVIKRGTQALTTVNPEHGTIETGRMFHFMTVCCVQYWRAPI
jgi:hypothetical protein